MKKKYTDYKFNYINDYDFLVEIMASFYEGDYDKDGVYIRSKKLRETKYVFRGPISHKEAIKKMNKELAKDKTRKPIKQERNADYTREN